MVTKNELQRLPVLFFLFSIRFFDYGTHELEYNSWLLAGALHTT